jgi:hypothetical protein
MPNNQEQQSNSNIGADGNGIYITANDIIKMAKLGISEAGTNASPAHQATCGVIVTMNRMNHPSFPNSIDGVIQQANQYEVYRNGKYASTQPTEAQIATMVAALDTLRAEKGLAGAFPDIVNDAFYFSNPDVTARRGTSHGGTNILPQFRAEGHAFTNEKTFDSSTPKNTDHAPIYSQDAQELVNQYRNHPAYHRALEDFAEKYNVPDMQRSVYAYLETVENVEVASLNGVNRETLTAMSQKNDIKKLINDLSILNLNGNILDNSGNAFEFSNITQQQLFSPTESPQTTDQNQRIR